jgi:hypothetical protein
MSIFEDIGGTVGDIISGLGGGGEKKAAGIQEQMLAEARNLPLPVLKEYYPELYQSIVQMNPELETAVNLGPSAMQGVSTDPALRQAQMNALSKLEQIGLGEESVEDVARMNNITNDVNTNLQGQMGAIQQNLAQRGLSGSGLDMVQRNMAAQGAANRQANMALDAKAQAERRALDAIMQSGQLGGQMQSQDFSQQQAKAQAADAIAKFNAANQQGVQSANVGAKNNAQMWNAQQQQAAQNQNTDLRNQANLRNLNLTQQQYENELKKRGLVSGAQQGLADTYAGQAASNRQMVGGLIGAGAKAFAGG